MASAPALAPPRREAPARLHSPPRPGTTAAILRAASWAAAGLGVAYLLSKAVLDDFGLDFRLVWVAGEAWRSGLSPYGPGFRALYAAGFGAGPATHFWVYPPWWLPIAAPFSLLAFAAAVKLWSVLNAGLLVAGAWLFGRSVGGRLAPPLTIAAAAACQPTMAALSLGQTSFLVFFGLALLYEHFRRGGSTPAVAGLALLSLKPTVGLFFLVFMLARGRRKETAFACGVVALMALPSLLLHGAEDASGFAAALRLYGAAHLHANLPPDLVGATHLISLVGEAPRGVLLLLMAVASVAFARAPLPDQARLSCTVAAAGLLLPLHDYDATFLILPAMWLASSRRVFAPMIAVLLLMRPGLLAGATGLVHPGCTTFPGALIVSIAALVLAAGVGVYLRSAFAAPRPSPLSAGKEVFRPNVATG